MKRSESINRVYAELRDEHKDLLTLLDQLNGYKQGADLVSLLEDLHDLLIRHFAHEQFPGGLYESLGINATEHREDLKVLVEDHCYILSAVRGLLERARLGRERDSNEELHEIITKIQDHEQREHALAEKVINRLSSGASAGTV